jgi:hypothetical protein
MQITKLDRHIRKAQPGVPQDSSFAALQLAAFQTLPVVHHSSPAKAPRHYPALPSSMQRSPQQISPPSGLQNDQTAANLQHDLPAAYGPPFEDPKLRQPLSEPQNAVLAAPQQVEPLGLSKEGWQAHECRLAALEASLLERANLASKALSHVAVTKSQVLAQLQTFP